MLAKGTKLSSGSRSISRVDGYPVSPGETKGTMPIMPNSL